MLYEKTLQDIGVVARSRGWDAVLQLPVTHFVATVPTGAPAKTVLLRLIAAGHCKTIGDLCGNGVVHTELVTRLGSAGLRNVADALAHWVQTAARATAEAPGRPAIAPVAQAARPRPEPKSAPKPLETGLRIGMPARELDAWAAASPAYRRVLSMRAADLLKVADPSDNQQLYYSYRTPRDIVRGTWQVSEAIRAATLDALRATEQGVAQGLAEEAQRLARGPLPDAQAEIVRQRLLRLRQDVRPTAWARRQQAVGAMTLKILADPPSLAVVEKDLQQWCQWHQGGPVLLRLDATPALDVRCGSDGCTVTLAAVDAAIDLLYDPAHVELAAQLVQFATRPAWHALLDGLDALLPKPATQKATTTSVQLGWRLHAGYDAHFEPVWVEEGKKGLKVKKAKLKDLRLDPALCTLPLDATVAAILLPDPRAPAWQRTALDKHTARLALLLRDHPRLFLGDAPLHIEELPARLVAVPTRHGLRLDLRVGAMICEPQQVAHELALQQTDHWLRIDVDKSTCRVTTFEKLAPLLNLLGEKGNALPPEAVAAWLERLPRLQKLLPVDVPDALRGRQVAPQTRPVVRLTADGDALRAALRVRPLPAGELLLPGLGEVDVYGLQDEQRIWTQRNLASEQDLLQKLRQTLAPQQEAGWDLDAQGEAALDLVAALQAQQEHTDVEWVRGNKRVLRTASLGDLRLQVSETRDWFGVSGSIDIEGQRAELTLVLDALRSGRRFVAMGGDLWLRLSDELRAQLQPAVDVLHPSKHGLELSPLHARTLADLGAQIEAGHHWRHVVERVRASDGRVAPLPDGLQAELRDYQLAGFRWLARLAAWSPGAVLADDMGLGKTVQALALLLDRQAQGPALVVAPTSVEGNWLREAERFAPGLRCKTYRHQGRAKLLEDLAAGDVLILSYDLLVRDADSVAKVPFATLVLDEAHAVKNATTLRAKAVANLQADFRVALTGTPVENHAGELWALMRGTVPGLLGSWEQFRDRFAAPEQRPALARAIRPFVLRRLKSEVAKELPARTEIVVDIELTPGERRLYDEVRLACVAELSGELGSVPPEQRRFLVLAAITRLRQLACHPRLHDENSALPSAKLARLEELLTVLREEGHRALVFSQFTRHLALVRKRLDELGFTHRYLDGQTPAQQRLAEVDAFQRGEGEVFLLSLKAGGTGLNLTAADYVIHLDPWWNPAVEDQATDRAHRIGQTRPVTVYRLVTRGTIEEPILQLHAQKRDLVAGLLDGTGQAEGLTVEDLLALLAAGGG